MCLQYFNFLMAEMLKTFFLFLANLYNHEESICMHALLKQNKFTSLPILILRSPQFLCVIPSGLFLICISFLLMSTKVKNGNAHSHIRCYAYYIQLCCDSAALSLLGEKTTVLSPEVIVSSGIPCCR